MEDGSNATATTNESINPDEVKNLPAMVQAISSSDRQAQMESLINFRKLLSLEDSSIIEQVITIGTVPIFVQILANHENSELQFEAARSLTEIALSSTENLQLIIKSGVLPLFVKLLDSPNDKVRQQVVWAIANIFARDFPNARNSVLTLNPLPILARQITETSKANFVYNTTWAIYSLCRAPYPSSDQVLPVIPVLAKLINTTDQRVLTNVLVTLSDIAAGGIGLIQAVLDSGVVRRVVELLTSENALIQHPALRIIAHLATGEEHQTKILLDSAVLVPLAEMLSSSNKLIQKDVCSAISNIMADGQVLIQPVIAQSNIIPKLLSLLHDDDKNVKEEAARTFVNAISGGTPEQIQYLVNCGIIESVCTLLQDKDPEIAKIALKIIAIYLQKTSENEEQTEKDAENYSTIAQSLMTVLSEGVKYGLEGGEDEGMASIEDLQAHPFLEVYSGAIAVYKAFFCEGDDGDDGDGGDDTDE